MHSPCPTESGSFWDKCPWCMATVKSFGLGGSLNSSGMTLTPAGQAPSGTSTAPRGDREFKRHRVGRARRDTSHVAYRFLIENQHRLTKTERVC